MKHLDVLERKELSIVGTVGSMATTRASRHLKYTSQIRLSMCNEHLAIKNAKLIYRLKTHYRPVHNILYIFFTWGVTHKQFCFLTHNNHYD